MAKQRKHTFQISVTFDKKCTARVGLREVKDNIHGPFYTTQYEDSDPGEFRVRRISPLKKGKST